MRKLLFLVSLVLVAGLGCSSGPVQVLSLSSVTPASITTGTAATITVTGQQFTARTSIRLASTTVTTTLVSPTQMTAAVPLQHYEHAGRVPRLRC